MREPPIVPGRLFAALRNLNVFVIVLQSLFSAGVVFGQTPLADAFADFSMASNPNGQWSYGYTLTRGSPLILFTHTSVTNPWFGCAGLGGWYENLGDAVPSALANTTSTVNRCGSITAPPGMMVLHPGPNGENGVARWTAPATGDIGIVGNFQGADNTTTDVAVLLNSSTVLFSGNINGLGDMRAFPLRVHVNAGDRIDFSVGYGSDGAYDFDSTAFEATISTLPNGQTQLADAFWDFSMASNPNGQWAYGYTLTRGSPLILFTHTSITNPWFGCAGLGGWYENLGDAVPSALANTTGAVNKCGSITAPAQMMVLHPGPNGENGVARWTAAATGDIVISGKFQGADNTTTDVAVLLNSSNGLFSGNINGLGDTRSFQLHVHVNTGDRIDFSVGYGSDGAYDFDSTAFEATISTEALPAIGSMAAAPASGYGLSGQFTFHFSDLNGAGDIARTWMMLSATQSTAQACDVTYLASTGRFYLGSDDMHSWIGGLAPGAAGTLSNSQCTLNGATSLVGLSGNNLTITLNLTFAQAFIGQKQALAYVQDTTGQHAGWTNVGQWIVGSGVEQAPSVGTLIAPAGGQGISGQFQFEFSDANGNADIMRSWMLFSRTGSTANACEVLYVASGTRLYLLSDDGGGWIGPVQPGGPPVNNSQCTLTSRVVAAQSANEITITLNLVFSSSFAGATTIFGCVQDWAGAFDPGKWKVLGNWTVQ